MTVFCFSDAQSISRARYGQGTAPIVMDNAQCGGSEENLASCTYLNINNLRRWSHREDAGVRCQQRKCCVTCINTLVQFSRCIIMIASSVAAAVTGPPQSVRITAHSSTTLSISWSPPLINQRYGAILRYNVSCLGSSVLQFHHTTDNSTSIVGLHPYTRYSCCISAITTMAEGTRACVSTRTLATGK